MEPCSSLVSYDGVRQAFSMIGGSYIINTTEVLLVDFPVLLNQEPRRSEFEDRGAPLRLQLASVQLPLFEMGTYAEWISRDTVTPDQLEELAEV